MTLFVDTSIWSLAFRRDAPAPVAQVDKLTSALEGGDPVLATGIVLQELLQGFAGPKAQQKIIDRFKAIPLVVPDRGDHIAAAELRNRCRRAGVQVGTVDVLLAQLCIRHGLRMLTTDNDFRHMTPHCKLKIWSPPA